MNNNKSAFQAAVKNVLIGRTVKKISKTKLELDNGSILELVGNEGGCSCGGGDYELTELNSVHNVITAVEFEDNPGGDHYPNSRGTYRIFVYANNDRINLATFEGSDGSGYYGTGYYINVTATSTETLINKGYTPHDPHFGTWRRKE